MQLCPCNDSCNCTSTASSIRSVGAKSRNRSQHAADGMWLTRLHRGGHQVRDVKQKAIGGPSPWWFDRKAKPYNASRRWRPTLNWQSLLPARLPSDLPLVQYLLLFCPLRSLLSLKSTVIQRACAGSWSCAFWITPGTAVWVLVWAHSSGQYGKMVFIH